MGGVADAQPSTGVWVYALLRCKIFQVHGLRGRLLSSAAACENRNSFMAVVFVSSHVMLANQWAAETGLAGWE